MPDPATPSNTPPRPMRADARRNYEKLLQAARDAFAEDGSGASLEDVARRAGVGIGTLDRHFPTRQDLLEAAYVDEVRAMQQWADDLAGEPPWDALVDWLRRYVRYAVTKRALGEELILYIDHDADVFATSRAAIIAAGEPLLRRAQEAGVVRADTDFPQVGRLVGGIAAIRGADPDQIEQILDLALDGLRYRAAEPG